MDLFTDVSKNQKMWARLVKNKSHKNDRDGEFYYLEIHVRSVTDIEGGGWDHGKFGSGSTHVIN